MIKMEGAFSIVIRHMKYVGVLDTEVSSFFSLSASTGCNITPRVLCLCVVPV
jgi:hypothetical protein